MLLAYAGDVLHALWIALICIAVGVPLGATAYVVYRVRRRRREMPALGAVLPDRLADQLTAAEGRTVVTDVRVRALGAQGRAARAAIGSRAAARRER